MITFKTFLIVAPLVFLGGLVDAIGGGGGLISLPAYLLAGIPSHMAIATNKLSSALGTTVTTIRFIREKLVSLKYAIPGVICAMAGSFVGAKLSLITDEKILGIVILPVLFVAAFFVLNKGLFGKEYSEEENVKRVLLTLILAALFIGMYDGFYGPGTGTFLIIAFNVFSHMNLKRANAQAKVINLTTNLTSFSVFLAGGQVIWILGLVAAVCGMAGNFVGSNLAIKKSGKVTKPIILTVLAILLVKVVYENFLS